ncbi:UPF0739 protein C1orf74 homolog [Salarias fasciatus]|nr:UPF0739 protein C1orf74 homolog [Salarias fasciatus]
MSAQELLVAAARRCLRAGRKSLSVTQSLNLAAQVCAVDVGLKPSLLYDINGADAEQLQEYLSSLQSLQLVSRSLLVMSLNGNSFIVNPATVKTNIQQMLEDSSVAVVDVCHSLESPTIANLQKCELRSVGQELLNLMEEFEKHEEAEKPLYVGEGIEDWNLCSVFGLLLGYPVVYWFDQTTGFENCLSMTPLMVITASATWQADATAHRCGLYSFSLPAALQEETQSNLDSWKLRLQEKFEQQHVLKDLSLSQSHVTLSSVCL